MTGTQPRNLRDVVVEDLEDVGVSRKLKVAGRPCVVAAQAVEDANALQP